PHFVAMSGEVPALEQLLRIHGEYDLIGEVEKLRIEVCVWHLVHLLLHGTAQQPLSEQSMRRLAQWVTALRNGEDPAESLVRTSAPTDLAAVYATEINATKLNVSRSPAKTRLVDGAVTQMPDGCNRLPKDLKAMPGAEGHIATAMATDSVRTRREEL